MNCEQARELVALAASGDVTAAERRALAAHTAGCTECLAESNSIEALCCRLTAMREESVPEYVYAAVRSRVIGEINQRRRPRWVAVWPAFAAVALCSLVLAVAIDRQAPPASRPADRRTAEVSAAASGVPDTEPANAAPSPPRHFRKLVPRAAQAAESGEPMVVHMFTDDPDVVVYWIADAGGNRAKKEAIQ